MKIIVKSRCSCTWDYITQSFCLRPGGNCMCCDGSGIIIKEMKNVIEYKVIIDKA